MSLPIKGVDIGNLTRHYLYVDGKIEERKDGSRSWRNNNPGNIRDYDIDWKGLIGTDSDQFCMFNSYEMGKRALQRDITTKAKRGLSLSQIIYIYAPPNENDTEAYIRSVSKQTGIPKDLPMLAFMDKIPDVADAMEKHEGYFQGEIRVINGKGENPKKEGAYIWRTQGDAKVRSSHSLRDGKMYMWDDPPEGGHPGEDYGCRCIAEPITDEKKDNSKKFTPDYLK